MPEATNDERQFSIQRIYTKDVSFETPNSPQVFTQEWQPEINVGINSEVNTLDESHYEVVLTINIEAKHDDSTAFLAEVHQAGIFMAKNFGDDLAPMLGIGGPTALFPYAREVISELVAKGSFPQFILQPVNFEAMFAQQQAQPDAASKETH